MIFTPPPAGSSKPVRGIGSVMWAEAHSQFCHQSRNARRLTSSVSHRPNWFWSEYLGGVLEDGEEALLDAADQLESSVQVFGFQQPHARGQVSALQQSLL